MFGVDFTGQLGAGEGLLVTSDDVVLRDFGPRPVERVDFTRWAAVERSPGQYTRPEWNALRRAHLNGSTIISPT